MNQYHFASFALLAFTSSLFSHAATAAESPAKNEAASQVAGTDTNQSVAGADQAKCKLKISDLDTNDDDLLSRREIPASHVLSAQFQLVDLNHNGYITGTELANWK